MTAPQAEPVLPTFSQALKVWWRVGCLSFGGPAGQIALLHREVVDNRRWISDRRFLHALNFCSLLPGPEAQQLATYLGWLMHGAKGGFAAGLLFVLPGAFVMLGLSCVYVLFGEVPIVSALFFGLKSAVLVLVVDALMRVAKRALKGPMAWVLAAAAFAGLFLFAVPFPAVVLAAAFMGFAAPALFSGGAHGAAKDGPPALLDALFAQHPEMIAQRRSTALRAGFGALVAWMVPLIWLWAEPTVFHDIALFFSKMAVVTFGGAYAVLAYVAQEAVEGYGWLTAAEMLSGLGLAETTPGPLILVLQFVGFLAGFRAEGGLHGIAGGIAGSVLTLWVTFAPCFVFVFLGAPLIERLQERPAFAGALAAITAAVVGVIGNLALWFGLRVLFHDLKEWRFGPIALDVPVVASVDLAALGIAMLAALALFRFRLGLVKVLGLCALAGAVTHITLG